MGRFKQWEELTIQDNFLFQKVMQNQRICKYLIEKILGIRIEKITFPEGEKSIDNRYDSKSIRLDVYVHDENGHVYDIEMQCTNGSEGELPKRTRYYQGMIDMDELKKGQYYTELKESFIIFIHHLHLYLRPLRRKSPHVYLPPSLHRKGRFGAGGSFDKDLPERERRK